MGMGAVNPMSVTECSNSGFNPNVSKLIFPAFVQPMADFQINNDMLVKSRFCGRYRISLSSS